MSPTASLYLVTLMGESLRYSECQYKRKLGDNESEKPAFHLDGKRTN